jgi:hypothetical protein
MPGPDDLESHHDECRHASGHAKNFSFGIVWVRRKGESRFRQHDERLSLLASVFASVFLGISARFGALR